MCAGEEDNNRYLYYLVGTALWRYDTFSDGNAEQLAACPYLATTGVTLRYSTYAGYRCNVLTADNSGTYTKITCPGVGEGKLVGKKVRVVYGTGEGQTATVTTD